MLKIRKPEAPVVVIDAGEPLTDEQMKIAFHVGDSVLWWRALVQLINVYRMEYAASAAQNATMNNPLAMANDVGSFEALSGLLNDLEERRLSGD